MKKYFSFSLKRLILFVLLAPLPMLLLLSGTIHLFKGGLPTFSLVKTNFLFPIAALLTFAWIAFFNFKTSSRDTKILLSGLIALFVFLVCVFFKYEKIYRYENQQVTAVYKESTEEFSLMPSIESVDNYEQIIYYSYNNFHMIFEDQACILFINYSAENYLQEKQKLNTNYIFQAKSMAAYGYSCSPTAQIGNYHFRVLSIEGEYGRNLYYPKNMMLIATNDQTYEIVYIGYQNFDLDYIESLEQFLFKHCGWNHIVR